MKCIRICLATFAMMLSASQAQALVMEYDEYNVGLGRITLSPPDKPMEMGASDTITFLPNYIAPIKKGMGWRLMGLMPAMSQLTITYNSTGYVQGGHSQVAGYGEYSYFLDNNHYRGKSRVWSTYAVPNMISETSSSKNWGDPVDTSLAFVSALFNEDDSSKATVIIRNNSAGLMVFYSIFEQLFDPALGITPSVTATYEVTATPLPGALPLMATGLMALLGVRSRKKAKRLTQSA